MSQITFSGLAFQEKKKVTRREFVADAGKIGLGVMIVPRHVLGGVGFQAPSDTMNFAVIGFGGMGSENALELAKTPAEAAQIRLRLEEIR